MGHCAPCLLPPTQTSSRYRGQQWKKPEVTKMSYFRYLIFDSGQPRTNSILFSCYVRPLWCSQCFFHPMYLFLQQAIAQIIHPNWLLETKHWMSMTLARGTHLQKPLIHVCDKQCYGRKQNFKVILPSLAIKSDSLVASVILIVQFFVSSKQGLSSKLIYVKINWEQAAHTFSSCLWPSRDFSKKEHRCLLTPGMAPAQQTPLLSPPQPSTHLGRPGSHSCQLGGCYGPQYMEEQPPNPSKAGLLTNWTLFYGLNLFSATWIMEVTLKMDHYLKVCNA